MTSKLDGKSNYPRAPQVSFGQAIAIGLGAGAIGAVSMVITSKIEQSLLTNRPNSYVPANTMTYWLGLRGLRRDHPDIVNHMHHFGMAFLGAPVRAALSYYGIIGPFSSLVIFLPIRIAIDQFFEMNAGASSWPWTWPINEQWIDVGIKGLFSLVVGYTTDKYVRGADWFNA